MSQALVERSTLDNLRSCRTCGNAIEMRERSAYNSTEWAEVGTNTSGLAADMDFQCFDSTGHHVPEERRTMTAVTIAVSAPEGSQIDVKELLGGMAVLAFEGSQIAVLDYWEVSS